MGLTFTLASLTRKMPPYWRAHWHKILCWPAPAMLKCFNWPISPPGGPGMRCRMAQALTHSATIGRYRAANRATVVNGILCRYSILPGSRPVHWCCLLGAGSGPALA